MRQNIKKAIKKAIIKAINSFNISSEKWGTPKGFINALDWCEKNGANYKLVYAKKEVTQAEPIRLDEKVHKLYRDEYVRTQSESFVASFNHGRVWGRNGAVITPDDLLLYDVSREFGAYGGVYGKEHSVFKQIKLTKPKYIDGTVAVLASPGANNFHHWLYDNMPRLHLIQRAGFLNEIDYFILDYTDLPFQRETLRKAGIPESKILNCHNNWEFHIKAKRLVVPSLPSRLGVISDWTVDYLRDLIIPQIDSKQLKKRIYISRKKAPSRKIVNEEDLFSYLGKKGFKEYFAEDYSITETAELFNEAEFIIGVHGSGLSNLVFAGKGVKVIDIIAPKHLDPYYWVLTGFQQGVYAYFSGEGCFDEDAEDLVKDKIDHDIRINLALFEQLFQRIEKIN